MTGAAERPGTLVFLIGPLAVGKMAAGAEVSRMTELPLFRNDVSIEAVLPLFGLGDPALDRIVAPNAGASRLAA